MKVVLIFDSGLAGAGGKSNPECPLTATREVSGTAILLEPYLKKIDGQISATLYCGMGYYQHNQSEVINKMTAMVKKLQPDFVLCGPSFNFLDYSEMCASCVKSIQQYTTVKACAMMSVENADTIAKFKNEIAILKMPKKGGTGLTDSFEHLSEWIDAAVNQPNTLQSLQEKYCY